jgi:hypothetical protein
MSLFIRMTQTRAGSERLLEARILPVLAQCDYLDARPEYDQTFVGTSSNFLTVNKPNLAHIRESKTKTPSFLPPSNATTNYSCRPFKS